MANVGKSIIGVGNLVKKVFDVLDDIFIAAKEIFGPIAGKIAYAGALGLVNFFEFVEGIMRVRKAYKNENIRQRKSRIVSGVLASTLSFIGLGLSTTVLL